VVEASKSGPPSLRKLEKGLSVPALVRFRYNFCVFPNVPFYGLGFPFLIFALLYRKARCGLVCVLFLYIGPTSLK
jgi:hypothetical protein